MNQGYIVCLISLSVCYAIKVIDRPESEKEYLFSALESRVDVKSFELWRWASSHLIDWIIPLFSLEFLAYQKHKGQIFYSFSTAFSAHPF